jgi:hypothetical protein
VLFHAFEQGSLGAGWHPIDLVDEEQISENRSSMKLEGARGHVQNVRADNIRRQEIGSALNALEG